jgi:hypothetical protein
VGDVFEVVRVMSSEKIYSSYEYISPEKQVVGNLQLEVNSMWKFPSRDVCLKKCREDWIAYDLKECIEIVKPGQTRWRQAGITTEIKEELVKMGYTLGGEKE